jgi:hypothetical protein
MSSAEGTPGETARRSGGPAVPVWFLISRRQNNRLEVLTVSSEAGREIVPVFGSEATAGAFLECGGFGVGWDVRETTAGELISLLLSHLSHVDRVVTDPPASASVDREFTRKKDFIGALMGEPLLIRTA